MSTQYDKIIKILFEDHRSAWLWLPVRLYVGYVWFIAGWEKFISPAWIGSDAGKAVSGFLTGALSKTAGAHPDVSAWYAALIQNVALPHPILLSYLVTYGEIAVGLGLILGLYTGLAAFLGAFMNFNYLLAGTVSINPILILLEIPLILAWRTAGWLGLDRFQKALPR